MRFLLWEGCKRWGLGCLREALGAQESLFTSPLWTTDNQIATGEEARSDLSQGWRVDRSALAWQSLTH